MEDIWRFALAGVKAGRPTSLLSVVENIGSVPGKTGTKLVLVDEEELHWLLVREVVDPLLDEYGVEAIEAILDAISQRPELLSYLKSILAEAGRVKRGD